MGKRRILFSAGQTRKRAAKMLRLLSVTEIYCDAALHGPPREYAAVRENRVALPLVAADLG